MPSPTESYAGHTGLEFFWEKKTLVIFETTKGILLKALLLISSMRGKLFW